MELVRPDFGARPRAVPQPSEPKRPKRMVAMIIDGYTAFTNDAETLMMLIHHRTIARLVCQQARDRD